jgi:hypothetical protein
MELAAKNFEENEHVPISPASSGVVFWSLYLQI